MRLAPAALLLSFACRGSTPDRTLEEYRQAIAANDPERAWALHDESWKRSHDKQTWQAFFHAESAERARLISELEHARTAEGSEQLELPLSTERQIRLVREGDGWKIASGGLEPGAIDAPDRTLLAFFEATKAGDLEGIRQLLPLRAAERYQKDPALRDRLKALAPRIQEAEQRWIAAPGPPRFEVEGDRAVARYAPGRAVRLAKEAGRWRVVDLE